MMSLGILTSLVLSSGLVQVSLSEARKEGHGMVEEGTFVPWLFTWCLLSSVALGLSSNC